ncbi:MAG: hypothetical protein ACE5FS_00050 [Paracoccaceae bacterium]
MTSVFASPRENGVWGQLWYGESVWSAGLWYLFSVACLLWVFLANGVPLYYFDTGGYLLQGERFLDIVGLMPDDGAAATQSSAAGGAGTGAQKDNTVQGGRSLIYGITLALFHTFMGFASVVFAQAALLVVAVWLSVRVLLRVHPGHLSVAATTGLCILAASLGSAAFYTAFLMPDIFAPIQLLMLAALMTLLPGMRWWETALAFILASTSVVMHPSHLLIALVLVPVAPLAAFLSGSRRVVLSSALVAAVALIGVTERFAFVVATETVTDSEVVYRPFITARLIVDGPGLEYLDDVCPQAGLATCELRKLLVRPRQITASHIIFAQSEELGSLRLLPEETQERITEEQVILLRGVLMTHPISFVRSVVGNTMTQLFFVNAYVTLPDGGVTDRLRRLIPEESKELTDARLTSRIGWLPWFALFQLVIYGLSLVTIIAGVFLRSVGAGWPIRTFAATVFVGILANSLVCGAVSQPSDRYGARIVFLLPVLAILFFSTKRASDARSSRAGPTGEGLT